MLPEDDETTGGVGPVEDRVENFDDVTLERKLGVELVARVQRYSRKLARVRSQATEKHRDDSLEVYRAEIAHLGVEVVQVERDGDIRRAARCRTKGRRGYG